MLNFKETYVGELIAKYNEYEFKIYENYETKMFKLDLLNTKTKIQEAKGLVGQGTLESLKKLADEMLEYRLNDKDYFKKSLEFEIELIEKHPERFENPQLELLLLKTSLIRIKNAR